jgi:hypothetical protein
VEEMTNVYLQWFFSLGDAGLANDTSVASSQELQDEYLVEVFDTFSIWHWHCHFLVSC